VSRELVTTFLDRWQRDQGADAAEILPAIYDELRALARSYLARERVDHTLQPTALVHEAYLRLVDQERVSWRGRNHFLAVAAIAMRRLLVDHARGRRRDKRGGDAPKLSLTAAMPVADEDAMADEIVAVDDLLQTLAGFDARAAEVVQCRYFGGLTIEETAAALGLSPMTVKRSWQTARAWLRKELAARGQG
jgi:RNA polymerase sigma factor (TIGR02999 family)